MLPRQSVGGGKFTPKRVRTRFWLLKATALTRKWLLATPSKILAWCWKVTQGTFVGWTGPVLKLVIGAICLVDLRPKPPCACPPSFGNTFSQEIHSVTHLVWSLNNPVRSLVNLVKSLINWVRSPIWNQLVKSLINLYMKIRCCSKVAQGPFHCYLTECVNQMAWESQLPQKNVNLFFQLVIVNNKLTILWGSWLLKPWNLYIVWDIFWPRRDDLQMLVHLRPRHGMNPFR